MKAPSSAGTREGMIQGSALSSDQAVDSGDKRSCHGGGEESTRRLCGSRAVVSRRPPVCDDAESGEATECANVKLELGLSSPLLTVSAVTCDSAT